MEDFKHHYDLLIEQLEAHCREHPQPDPTVDMVAGEENIIDKALTLARNRRLEQQLFHRKRWELRIREFLLDRGYEEQWKKSIKYAEYLARLSDDEIMADPVEIMDVAKKLVTVCRAVEEVNGSQRDQGK
ncbi:hypothetical protein LTR37_015558 [Vermiconidia calcicola]|uniref:Uncharacterized protein n=1 Tax=Vermiconidia calcicola TaxID=1690605 RepID=A0ACC3MS06_9PEZI|nr:hypothetical protein LTR37_015558 [Vermiconidia calcicola]